MVVELDDEHEAVRATASAFAEDELRPVVSEWEGRGEFPPGLIEELAEYDMRGVQVPVEYGGAGMGMLAHAVVMEEVSKVWPAAGIKMDEGLLRYLRLFGTNAQKEAYLPRLASGEWMDAIALSEPGHGSDFAGIETTAERADGGYRLNGEKTWVTNAGIADLIAIAAKTDPDERHHGISIFLVRGGADGMAVQPPEDLMGYRASNSHGIVLDDCFVPEEDVLGSVDEGFFHTMEMLRENRIAVAARGLGIARGAFEESVEYAREREQFGRPIADFQAIKHKLADMAVAVENCRHLVYNAARRYDDDHGIEREASMAKLYTSEAAREVANEGVQIHGGYGYSREYPIEMFYRDAKGLEIYEGTSEIQRTIIADRVLE